MMFSRRLVPLSVRGIRQNGSMPAGPQSMAMANQAINQQRGFRSQSGDILASQRLYTFATPSFSGVTFRRNFSVWQDPMGQQKSIVELSSKELAIAEKSEDLLKAQTGAAIDQQADSSKNQMPLGQMAAFDAFVLATDNVNYKLNDSWTSVNLGMNHDPVMLLRGLHAAMPVVAFFVMYAHIARGYVRSIQSQHMTQATGAVILVLGYAVAFLGYAMVYGDMGYWAAGVIFSLLDCIPQILPSLFGDFALGYTAVTKIYTLHYLTGILFAAMIMLHVLTLHVAGSWYMLPVRKNTCFVDLLAKDSFIILIGAWAFSLAILAGSFVYMVHGENDVYPINMDATPAHIVPEAYLLSVYGGLKAVPNKASGIASAALLLGMLFMH